MADVRYRIVVARSAQKQLFKLPIKVGEELNRVIASLSENPRPVGYKKLVERGAYRVRSGQYRIVYEIDDEVVTVQVIAVGHRKDIYRMLK